MEKDPPLDADRPEVLAWLIGTEVERRCTGTLEVRAGDDRVRTVVVSVPSDTAVAVSLACAPGAS